MSGKYTQEELLKMAKELPNTHVVLNSGRLELRMTAPLSMEERYYEELDKIIEPVQHEPQVNPNEILHNMLDHIHDGNREELIGEMILMLGWLHKGGTMPNISKDTVTSTTLWIIPQND